MDAANMKIVTIKTHPNDTICHINIDAIDMISRMGNSSDYLVFTRGNQWFRIDHINYNLLVTAWMKNS
jgi:hypothetical protein